MASSNNAPSLERSGGRIAVRRLQDVFHLPACRTSVPEARRRVLATLYDWGACQQTCEDAELVVCELFTNAVRHADGESVECEMTVIGDCLRVEVADGGTSRTEPMPRPRCAERESGRGLLLVGALSDSWGVRDRDQGPGRVVWADLPYRGLH
ncbi:ATP-binding protein [Streptomyces sp. NPDC059740]|uniref:ATP-binding protein n=1 Tax=Streptomyces sp. NPDC059740 TaxID=3346926 RepID=UPI00365087A0